MRQISRAASIVLLTVLLAIAMSSSAWAQLYAGSITGIVHDPSGAVVAKAKVTLIDVTKNFKFEAVTGGDGRYLFPSIQPSIYSVTVQAPGFKTADLTGIEVGVNANVSADVNLEVGTTGESVIVNEANAPQVQTEDASTGQTIDRKLVNDLPLIGRGVFDLAFLAPGVSQPTGNAYGPGAPNGVANNFVSEGSRNAQSDIVLDGASLTTYEQNTGFVTPLYTPSVDAVQEFKVQQTNFSAEFGFTGGTVVNVVTRSGGNKFHGSAYEFFRNTDLNANTFFNNNQGVANPPYHWNDFGGTIGGPILKDKLFFFFDYEGSRQITPASARLGVPDSAERTGDFGELCTSPTDAGGVGGTFNSAGQCSVAGGQVWDPYDVDTTQTGNHYSTTFVPFNNMGTYASANTAGVSWITPGQAGNLLNPSALAMIGYLPHPNVGTPGTAGYDPLSNFYGTGSNLNNSNQFDAKADYRPTGKDIFSLRVSHAWGNSLAANILNNFMDSNTQGPIVGTTWSGALSWNRSISPKTLVTATAAYIHNWSDTAGIAGQFPNFNYGLLDLPDNLGTSGFKAPPAIVLDSYAGENGNASFGAQPWSGLLYARDVGQIMASVSHISGKHELKFGGEWRVHRTNFTQYGLPAGHWEFQAGATAQNSNSAGQSATGGDSMASFLTGYATGWNAYEVPPSPATQNFQYAGFAQDNWHVSDRLTLNIGLRYDVDLPRTERHDRMSYFDPNAPFPLKGVVASSDCPQCGSLHGALEYVGANGNPRSPFDTYWSAVGPRLGLAFRLAKDTVIRGGYGIYYDPSKGGAAGSGSGAAGFQGYDQQTNWTVWNGCCTPDSQSVLGLNPTPSLPTGNSQGALTQIGNTISGAPIRSYNVLPREQSWSLGVERELPWHMLADAEYVGKKGSSLYLGGDTYALDHLPASAAAAFRANPNAFNNYVPVPASLAAAAQAQTPGYSNPLWASPCCGGWPAYNDYMPYPQYPFGVWGTSGLQNIDPPLANSIYHSLQLRLEKRFSQGLQFLATYTNQKSIDNASLAGSNVYINGVSGASLARIQDPNCIACERSLSQFDISQIFQFSGLYELPIGRGKQFGSGMSKLADTLVGGWQVNAIYRWDTGLPIILYLNNGVSLPSYGNQRPDLSGALEKQGGWSWSPSNSYFSNASTVLSAPAPYYDGNAPRVLSSVRAQGTNNVSASIFKDFPLQFREGAKLQLRAESFNLFNRVQFGAPNTTFGASNFGIITNQANQNRILQLALKLYF